MERKPDVQGQEFHRHHAPGSSQPPSEVRTLGTHFTDKGTETCLGPPSQSDSSRILSFQKGKPDGGHNPAWRLFPWASPTPPVSSRLTPALALGHQPILTQGLYPDCSLLLEHSSTIFCWRYSWICNSQLKESKNLSQTGQGGWIWMGFAWQPSCLDNWKPAEDIFPSVLMTLNFLCHVLLKNF